MSRNSILIVNVLAPRIKTYPTEYTVRYIEINHRNALRFAVNLIIVPVCPLSSDIRARINGERVVAAEVGVRMYGDIVVGHVEKRYIQGPVIAIMD